MDGEKSDKKEMKNGIFLFAGFEKTHAFDNIFSSGKQSAFELSLEWALGLEGESSFAVAVSPSSEEPVKSALQKCGCQEKFNLVKKDKWNTQLLLEELALFASRTASSCVVFAFGDCPFLNKALTRQVLESHKKYLAEYSFADGWPLGFAPEVIDCGALNILNGIAKSGTCAAAELPVTKESIFGVIKTDINSFEIETVMAPKDYRMYRFDFSCSTKANTLSCLELCKMESLDDAEALSDAAVKSAGVQQTVPAFYNIQISCPEKILTVYNPYSKKPLESKGMDFENFCKLASAIEEFSEQAVVGLGTFADPLLNAEFGKYAEEILLHKGLSILIETDALNVLEDSVMQQVKKLADSEPSRVTWIVSIDAFSQEVYNSIHGFGAEQSAFAKATRAVQVLSQLFPGNVWPQFTRMNANECELESFYRYWHDKASPSGGNVIIQKFDHACLFFSDERPADLSPLLRNPCWHLKRDMTVLGNGDVPLCRENEPFADEPLIVGNVFADGIEAVWNKFKPYLNEHIEKKYCGKCGKCDEYYTFNF